MLPPEIITALIAMTPVAEVRVSVPFAIHALGLSPVAAYFFSVAGNIVPAFSIVAIGTVVNWLSRRIYGFNRFFTWLFERTRRKHRHRVANMHELALLVVVAVPIPLTGVWTASLVAFLFGISFLRALPYLAAGSAIASFIMLLISLGAIRLF